MKIEILGSGCARCKSAEKNVRKAVEMLGIEAEVVKIEDVQELVNRGIMTPPAIVVDGKIVMTGRVPSPDDVKKMLQGR
jgi:small redox-active disulfide protein 2